MEQVASIAARTWIALIKVKVLNGLFKKATLKLHIFYSEYKWNVIGFVALFLAIIHEVFIMTWRQSQTKLRQYYWLYDTSSRILLLIRYGLYKTVLDTTMQHFCWLVFLDTFLYFCTFTTLGHLAKSQNSKYYIDMTWLNFDLS